jgi:hypothetical protein
MPLPKNHPEVVHIPGGQCTHFGSLAKLVAGFGLNLHSVLVATVIFPIIPAIGEHEAFRFYRPATQELRTTVIDVLWSCRPK